ncbi:MAG: cellulase family glycosylhydrolase [Lachnospiraceae bacterium]|nr:cellulase family glycosylhydrolase [Lachnospiraceae bacterium]
MKNFREKQNKLIMLLGAFIIMLSVVLAAAGAVYGSEPEDPSEKARPSEDGQLRVEGRQLVNEDGEAVMLTGISTHGLTWYPDFVNEPLFGQLSEEWDCDLIRLAMYSEEYIADKDVSLEVLHRGIDAAIKADMYVLVDWHILDDYDPMMNVNEAKAFFDEISKEYAGVPNIIYEICNEPNGEAAWDDIYEYCEIIIPVIRKNSPDAVIIIGTPDYDRDLKSPAEKPVPFKNVLYSFHFYTASHHEEMMSTLEDAVEAGLPVFISECGITEKEGDGPIDHDWAVRWFSYLEDHKISYAVWNLSNKNENSSFVKASSGARERLGDDDLTVCGMWIRELIKGEDPAAIARGAKTQEYGILDWFAIQIHVLNNEELAPVRSWSRIALWCLSCYVIFCVIRLLYRRRSRRLLRSYDDVVRLKEPEGQRKITGTAVLRGVIVHVFLLLALIYLCWRVMFSINYRAGWPAVTCNIILLIVEIFGYLESCVHFFTMEGVRKRPLPAIGAEEYPEVDIFISTYNETTDLIMRTVNGCKHLKYPDESKVHIWVCDDNRRPSMRALAESMGVGYFDRPDNRGAKAGNLNEALKRTSAPYIVTLDADMIVKSDFLMKTIPYFVYVENCCEGLPEDNRKHLGLLQTPQCFYDPDVFQFGLYSEKNIPNEQDLFYRTIEPGKTASNSVIYGGSNTVLSRRALLDAGGFYEGSITEDFATGMMIESADYLSLGLSEPLASGRTPHDLKDHVKQRTRWGRGVINTAKKLKLLTRRGLTAAQKLSYLGSVFYWYSPVKNLVYIMSPLMFAVFLIPVFKCTWLDLLIYWLPMFLMQGLSLRATARNRISMKWSSIYETSVMPFLFIPILKETFGISLTRFGVTDKSGGPGRNRRKDRKMAIPFLVLLALSVFGIIRVIAYSGRGNVIGMVVILFWIIRNMYSIVMALFLVNGRDEESEEPVTVKAAEMVSVKKSMEPAAASDRGAAETAEASGDTELFGITTVMTEHGLKVFLDEPGGLGVGDKLDIVIDADEYTAAVKGIITGVRHLRRTDQCLLTVEILEHETPYGEYLQILYDRVPTLPQSLGRDFGLISLLWRNIVYRAVRTV